MLLSWEFSRLLNLPIIFGVNRNSRSFVYRYYNHVFFVIFIFSRQSRFFSYLIYKIINILHSIFIIISYISNPQVSIIFIRVAFISVITGYRDLFIFIYIMAEALIVKISLYYLFLRKKRLDMGILSFYRQEAF